MFIEHTDLKVTHYIEKNIKPILSHKTGFSGSEKLFGLFAVLIVTAIRRIAVPRLASLDIMRAQLRDPLKALRPSQYCRIERFKGGPSLSPHQVMSG